MEIGGGGGGDGGGRKWEDLPYDVLTHIFSFLCIIDSFCNLSPVCKSWHAASFNPVLWKTLELDIYYRKFIQPNLPTSWLTGFNYSSSLDHFFKSVMTFNGGDLIKLLLPSGVTIHDLHLISMAQRSPNLKFLYIPPCPMITEEGLNEALGLWRNLKSVSISYLFYKRYLMFQIIGQNCKSVTSLKFADHCFDKEIANSITAYLPGLKILTILCFRVKLNALQILLKGMENLEELYISDMIDFHDQNINRIGPPLSAKDYGELNVILRKFPSGLKKFHYCRFGYCVNCPTARTDNKLIKNGFMDY